MNQLWKTASFWAFHHRTGNDLKPAHLANSFTGAQFRKGKKKGQVVIIPGTSTKTVVMTVKSGGTPLGKETFKRLTPAYYSTIKQKVKKYLQLCG